MTATANAGEARARYEKIFDWKSLMKDGFIVRLEVSFFRGRRKLSPAELGLDEHRITHDVQEVLRLGTKRVAPLWYAKQARSIESCARGLLDRHSLKSPFGPFVPEAAWEIVAPRLAQYEEKFNQLNQKLFDRWEEEKRLVLRQFEVAFKDLQLTPEQMEQALETVETSWPSLDEVKQATRWDVFAYKVDIPAAPADPETEAEKVKTAYIAKLESAFADTVEGFVGQLRGGLKAWAERVAESVGSRDEVPTRTINAIRKNIARFRALDVAGDEEIERLLDEMQELVDAGPAKLRLSDEEFASGIERAAKRIMKAAQKDLDPTKLRFASIAATAN